uniref:YEATS domain-containing protein 2 n=1 Tax=Laticauda laticaudata TaxID=8630 RepID=A0A8C5SWE1_LATLA
MSGIKRTVEEMDPDYEEISVTPTNKHHKASEQSARDAAVQKIEAIIKEQFSIEMKNKEHEIQVIDQRLIEARRMMDKLRACIVANYYASAGLFKVGEISSAHGMKSCDSMVFNHPTIKKFLESPSRSSSPANQGSETLSVNHSESESSQHMEYMLGKDNGNLDVEERVPSKLDLTLRKNAGQDISGVSRNYEAELRKAAFSNEEHSRLYVKKTIVVGNVSKYIPPDKREENDQSTHKWMVYVRGSRREPSIDHFVKKVWFFLHPSYKPNDLVEVREPPFHLTRRGWGEFPVRVQIHFKDSRNKRIDIIHHLKLDRTYTGLQTLGAETVVDVELHRHSLKEEYQSSDSDLSDAPNSLHLPMNMPAPMKASSPIKQVHESITEVSLEKGLSAESERHTTFYALPSSLERTPTKLTSQKVAFGSHSNSAFQPIAASCKIVPQGQIPNPAESPGKSFQPITMSCKIVSGSPISTPSPSPLPRTPTSTPVHMKQGAGTPVVSNPYVIVDKPGQPIGASVTNAGSPASKVTSASQSAHGTSSPVSKIHGSSFVSSTVKQEDSLFAAMPPLCPIGSHSKVQSPKSVTGAPGTFTKVIIKQEPGELPQHSPVAATGAASQASLPQYMTVKGSHVIALSPQKQIVSTGEGSTSSKIVSVPVGSTLPSSVKQAVALSGGQILVAKSSPSVTKTAGGKQIVTQGVAKAIVSSGGGTIVAQPVQTLTKAQVPSTGAPKTGSQGSVMATLQLPATNLANLANLPPGTKLYLTTNSKNPSGKGKLLLIPQGAILRATNNANQQLSSSGSSGTQGASSGVSQHLTYTSYILKQTPQGTFLVGQPPHQTTAKQVTSGTVVQGNTSAGTSSSQGQQALKVITGHKTATLFAQAGSGGQASVMKISDNTLKSLPASSQLSKPGATVLRVSGGVITAATTSAVTLASNGVLQQADSASSSSPSSTGPIMKISGQQQQVVANHGQAISVAPNKTSSSTVVSIASWVTTPAPASTKTAVSVIHSLSSSKATAVTPMTTNSVVIPSSPDLTVTKVKLEPDATGQSCSIPVSQDTQATIKTEESSELGNYSIGEEYLDNLPQLLTAIVKKVPLIAERTEDANPFCASSVEQYYTWNIGKQRAAEWQRALTIRKVLQEVIEKYPKFHSIVPLKTKQVVHWCRFHGYTPPDPEAFRNEDSIEDVLTQIDNEPECSSSYTTGEEMCRKLIELQQLLKQESDNDEEVDILNITEPLKINIKKEQEETQEEAKFYLAPQSASELVRETAQQVGISFPPVELHKNIYAFIIEDMILKATEQLVSDILREALAIGYQAAPRNRIPREITMMNIHQAICNIPFLDFLTNKHMGILNDEQ